jgi:hypothetical protein
MEFATVQRPFRENPARRHIRRNMALLTELVVLRAVCCYKHGAPTELFMRGRRSTGNNADPWLQFGWRWPDR